MSDLTNDAGMIDSCADVLSSPLVTCTNAMPLLSATVIILIFFILISVKRSLWGKSFYVYDLMINFMSVTQC